MLAIIGFFILFFLGLASVLIGLTAAYTTIMFSGRIEWPALIVLCVIGGLLIYLALVNSPFSITLTGGAA